MKKRAGQSPDTESSERDAPIRLVAYDRQWPDRFEQEQKLLERVLSPWLVGRIEHIGSTAVPGLEAKPIIDIMAPVIGLKESKEAIEAVRHLDYRYAPYQAELMHWFCKRRPSFRTHHLHLVPFGSELWMARLRFRDQLRENDKTAAEYSELKRNLALLHQGDRDAYTEGKSDFIARVVGESHHKIRAKPLT